MLLKLSKLPAPISAAAASVHIWTISPQIGFPRVWASVASSHLKVSPSERAEGSIFNPVVWSRSG
jgi:hypothetical protein